MHTESNGGLGMFYFTALVTFYFLSSYEDWLSRQDSDPPEPIPFHVRRALHRLVHQHLRLPPHGHRRGAGELAGLGAERLRRQRALPLPHLRSHGR